MKTQQDPEYKFYEGLSLRDYFAGQALYVAHQYEDCHVNAERLAMHAYNIADAMLEARKEE